MKKIISIFLLLATVATVSAQRFEWAKGYNAAREDLNEITGSVVDSLGNLYIMGNIRQGAEWDGECIVPAIYSPYPCSDLNLIIAKISPEGEMLWKKFVICYNGGGANPYDIKLVGDTAVVCLFEFIESGYAAGLYYLDTLVSGQSNYPCTSGRFYWRQVVANVSFDFDGNVTEEHFLRMSPVDHDGNDFYFYDIMPNDTISYLLNIFMQNVAFDVDETGNVYIYRQTNDRLDDSLNIMNGSFSAIKVWDDTRLVGTFPVEGVPYEWNQQILKFAPHFDTLLTSRYVIQKCDSGSYTPSYMRSRIDRFCNIYTIVTMYSTLNSAHTRSNCFVIDSIQNFTFSHIDKNMYSGYMIKYDSVLNVKWIVSFQDSVISSNNQLYSNMGFHGIELDSNFVFLSASTGRGYMGDTLTYYSILQYQNMTLSIKNDAFVTVFLDTGIHPILHSYISVPSLGGSNYLSNSRLVNGNLACSNNRIFTQGIYYGGVRYNDTYLPTETLYDKNLGLFVFDYAGHVITHIGYNVDESGRDSPGPIALRDSTLYLMSDIISHATFGDTTVYAWGQLACIAKYVDTSFMTPYVYTGEPEDLKIQMTEGEGAWLVYPNPFRQRVKVRHEGSSPIVKAFITDRQGRQTTLTVQQVDNRNYIVDFTSLPQDNYFLTLVTAAGNQRTVQIRKQSEVFGE